MSEHEDKENQYRARETGSSIARLEERVSSAREHVEQLELELKDYITRIEFMAHFWPVRALVYGMAALLLSSVLAAVIALVIVRPTP